MRGHTTLTILPPSTFDQSYVNVRPDSPHYDWSDHDQFLTEAGTHDEAYYTWLGDFDSVLLQGASYQADLYDWYPPSHQGSPSDVPCPATTGNSGEVEDHDRPTLPMFFEAAKDQAPSSSEESVAGDTLPASDIVDIRYATTSLPYTTLPSADANLSRLEASSSETAKPHQCTSCSKCFRRPCDLR